MTIIDLRELSQKDRTIFLEFVDHVSKNQGWNTRKVIEHLEKIQNKDNDYVCLISYNSSDSFAPNGFTVLTNQDGDNEDSSNFKIFEEKETMTPYWVSSFYVEGGSQAFIKLLNKAKTILVEKETYAYFENKKLKTFVERKFGLRELAPNVFRLET